MAEPTTKMTVDLPFSVKERLEKLSRTTSRSQTLLVADAIASYVDLQEWQIAEIRKGIADADAGDFASDDEVSAVFYKLKNAS